MRLGIIWMCFYAVSPAPTFAETISDTSIIKNPSTSEESTKAALHFLHQEGLKYEHGEGVPKNLAKAAALYCQGAKAGDPEARYSIGWMHLNGRGVTRDDAIAAYFFKLAAAQDFEPAKKILLLLGPPTSEIPECLRDSPIALENGPAKPWVLTNETQRKLAALINRLAPEYGIAPQLAYAIARTESNLNPNALSPKNAQGLMQLIPDTSARFNVRKPFDPEQNIRGGLAYLRWLLAYFRGDVALVAAAYNAGEGSVNQHLGIPPYAETQQYVKRILTVFPQREHPFNPAITSPSPNIAKIAKRMTSKPQINFSSSSR